MQSIPFPSRRNDERRKEKANEQIEKFYEIFKDMNFEISFLDALTLMPKFASTLKALIGNKEKLSEMAKLNETCSAVILNKLPRKLGGTRQIPYPIMDNKVTVIIAKELSLGEKADLIKVLKSHKRAIAWKLSDIQGINPEFCTHKILMEEDYKPTVQHQRRVNPKIHDVIKNEVEKLLDAGLIYPISDSPWVSPIHCVPKKGGFTVVQNEENELIPTRLVTGWRVCIDYRKLNESTVRPLSTPVYGSNAREISGKRVLLFP
ncbi:hypothetical protein Tco_0153686 [Tanacetum coccineum]